MDDNSLEFDWCTFDTNLDCPESAIISANFDLIVIDISIDIRFAEIDPSVVPLSVWSRAENRKNE